MESNYLVDLLSRLDVPRLDKILIILTLNLEEAKSISQIREIAIGAGLREAEKWNIADILMRAGGLAVKVKNGWTLTTPGKSHVYETYPVNSPISTKQSAISLREHLQNIKNNDTREFVEEAIKCLEHNLYRSAVVMSWAGAISILYDFVLTNRLTEFNNEAKRRKADWKTAVTKDDLASMKESDFLDILATLSIIGKNVKEHLKNNALNLRNSCGHPSSLKLGNHVVEAHIEFLIFNVYEKF